MGVRPRIRLIYNPTAGRGIFAAHLARVLRILEEAGLEASVHATTGPGDATREARRCAHDGFTYVAACGGDGTVNEVVNGIATAAVRPTVGIIPCGTTNDLARALDIPLNIEEAARRIARCDPAPLDLGCIGGDRFFVNLAACGRMVDLTYEVPARMKALLGYLSYVVKGIERLPGLRPVPIVLRAQECTYEGPAMLCVITNSRSVAGFARLAPNASVSDGLLDVIVLKPTHLANMIRLVTMTGRGEHVNDEHVLYFQTRLLEVESEDTVDLNIDGEFGGHLPYVAQVMPQHLSVLS